SIFEMVKQPSLLWACWHPCNLGEYQTIKQLWAAWHKSTIINSVGQMPPLLLIEQEWGGTKDHLTCKGCRQTWQPHNDNNMSGLDFLFCSLICNTILGEATVVAIHVLRYAH
ncbi:hypothetical protein EV702DRAFT_967726, partial [Suillus placidus]